MGRYIGTADFLNYTFGTTNPLAIPIYADDLTLINACIANAESAIDAETRRNFVGTAGTVFYNRYMQDRVRSNAFYLDTDLYRLSALTLGNGQDVPVGSVWLEPRSSGPPYRIVRLHSQYVYTWNTDSDLQVVGTWGYSLTAPAAIQQAALRYAVILYRQKDAAGNAGADTAGFPEAGQVTFPKGMPDDVRYLLAPYRSRTGGVV